MALKGLLGFNSRNKTQEALVKALSAKDCETSVRLFVQAAEDLRDNQTEYVFPIALNTDITRYDTPSETPSHINICVEYNPDKGFEINYRVMNINNREIKMLPEEELVRYISANGGISVGASMAHGNNILSARLKMIPSSNKSVSEQTQMMAMEVQDALVSGVIPDNASLFLSLVGSDGVVQMNSSGLYAEGLRIKGGSGSFKTDVSSEDNLLMYPIGTTGLNKKGQLYFETISQPAEGQKSNLDRMDQDFIAFGERDLTEYTDAIVNAIRQQKGLRDELEVLINEINDNYEDYQELSHSDTSDEKQRVDELNRMANIDRELRGKLDEVSGRVSDGKYIDFILQDPYGLAGPKAYILKRESHDCVVGVDKKILPGYDENMAITVEHFNEAVNVIQQKYDAELYKRGRKHEESKRQERSMTDRYGLGSTAIAVNTSDTYAADLMNLKIRCDQQLKDLAMSPLYCDLFTETYTVLDKSSKSREMGLPVKVFINPYMNLQEQDHAIEDAFSLAKKGERDAKPEVVEMIKALMRDSMDIENATGSISFMGAMDVFEILNDHLGETVTIKEKDQEWRITIVQSKSKGRDFDFLNAQTKEPEDLTELFVACHLKPQIVLSTEIRQGQNRITVTDKIKGFFKGSIGDAVKNFQKKLLSPGKQQEALSEVTAVSPEAQDQLKKANQAIYGAIASIQQVAAARFEQYKERELAMLANKLNMTIGMGAQAITSKALQQNLIQGDKKADLLVEGSGERLWNNSQEMAFYIAGKNDGVKEAIGDLYKQYQELAHTLKDNVSLSVEARKDGEIAVKKDLVFPKGKTNKPILIEYEKKDGKFVALPPHNITKEAAMAVISQAVEAQLFTPFQQAVVQTVEQEKMQDINEVLNKAEQSLAHTTNAKVYDPKDKIR